MGCDIHWYSETRREGRWYCDQANSFEIIPGDCLESAYPEMRNFPSKGRDYWLFGLLSDGVCCSFNWSFQGKGMPVDASEHVAIMHRQMAEDAHSHNFLDRQELLDKIEELRPIQAEMLISPPTEEHEVVPHLARRLVEIVGNLSADVPNRNQRIVFWFDN